MKRKVSIAIGALQRRFGDMRALEIAKEIGADAVDFDISGGRWDCSKPDGIYSKSDDEIIDYFSSLKKRADEIGLEVGQTHGRIVAFHNDEEYNALHLKNARIDCIATATLGAPVCVMHNVTTGRLGTEAKREDYHKLSLEMFSQVIPMAISNGIKIATETFGDSPSHGCVDFFGQINEFLIDFNRISSVPGLAEGFTMCADTGHSNKAMRFGEPTPGDVIRLMGKNVTCLHLNDNDTLTDQHKIPGTGTIDWKDVFDALDEVGYCGNYNMELSLGHFGRNFIVETAEFAVKVMRFMLKERYGE